MSVLAVIPARSGSKEIKKKNIIKINNHPLLAYSIGIAIKSKKINNVICSTDTEEIKEIAQEYGAKVPFLRPKNISGDDSRDIDFILHCINYLKKQKKELPELIVLLRPTTPLRKLNILDNAIKTMLENKQYDSLRSVCKAKDTPYKMWTINNKINSLQQLLYLENDPEPFNSPRQKLPLVYKQTGQIEIIRTQSLINYNSISGENIYPIIVDSEMSIDIDSMEDLKLAEEKIKNNKDYFVL